MKFEPTLLNFFLDGWDESQFGPWPLGGCMFLITRIPSANRSWSNPAYDKLPCVIFSNQALDHHGFELELRYLMGYRCTSANQKGNHCFEHQS